MAICDSVAGSVFSNVPSGLMIALPEWPGRTTPPSGKLVGNRASDGSTESVCFVDASYICGSPSALGQATKRWSSEMRYRSLLDMSSVVSSEPSRAITLAGPATPLANNNEPSLKTDANARFDGAGTGCTSPDCVSRIRGDVSGDGVGGA